MKSVEMRLVDVEHDCVLCADVECVYLYIKTGCNIVCGRCNVTYVQGEGERKYVATIHALSTTPATARQCSCRRCRRRSPP